MKDKKFYLNLTPEQLNTVLKIAIKEILSEEKSNKINKPLESYFIPETNSSSDDELVTLKEVAKMLNYSITTIRLKIYKKQIPCIKKGHRMVFKKLEIMKILEKK